MTTFWTKDAYHKLGSLTISGANTVVWDPAERVKVKRVILMVTTAQANASAEVTVGVRDKDDGNSSAHSAFTFPTGGAADTVYYYDVSANPDADGDAISGAPGIGGARVYDADPDLLEVLPGQEFFATSDGGGDNGVVDVYVQYQSMGFNPETLSNATELARA